MKWSRILLTLTLLAALAVPAWAGIFGKRGPKTNPADRVSELIITVKTDKDERKRADAADELRQFDPKSHPDVMPILIDVLLNDPSPSVRVNAAQSLTKLRPVSQQAGWALEQALANDSSTRVRLQARTSLWQYHLAGYRAQKNDGPVIQTKEPPLAPAPQPLPTAPAPSSKLTPMSRPLPTGPAIVPAQAPRLQPPPNGSGPELR
jgi:hypothetical protein